jgi:MerR family transcriptional regulator, light-induced transcriptional regulator
MTDPGGPTRGPSAEQVREELLRCLREHDKAAAVEVALGAVERGELSVESLYLDVLGPALVTLGAEWQRGQTAVWQEHLASTTVRTIIEALYPRVRAAAAIAPRSDRRALLACPPEETHDIGLRMLADRLDLAGWTVFFLGADAPYADLVAAAQALRVDTVLLSLSTHYHRVRVRDLVSRLDEELPGVRVMVGGPAVVHDAQGWPARHLFTEAELSLPPGW